MKKPSAMMLAEKPYIAPNDSSLVPAVLCSVEEFSKIHEWHDHHRQIMIPHFHLRGALNINGVAVLGVQGQENPTFALLPRNP